MPWSGQLCNFTNSSWWKVDLKKCNYTHLSYTRAQEVRKTFTGKEGIITRKQLARCSDSCQESSSNAASGFKETAENAVVSCQY